MINTKEDGVVSFDYGKNEKTKSDEHIIEEVRRLVERVDNLEGFQFFHSTAGGTGS